jgi:hypothetical protein
MEIDVAISTAEAAVLKRGFFSGSDCPGDIAR